MPAGGSQSTAFSITPMCCWQEEGAEAFGATCGPTREAAGSAGGREGLAGARVHPRYAKPDRSERALDHAWWCTASRGGRSFGERSFKSRLLSPYRRAFPASRKRSDNGNGMEGERRPAGYFVFSRISTRSSVRRPSVSRERFEGTALRLAPDSAR